MGENAQRIKKHGAEEKTFWEGRINAMADMFRYGKQPGNHELLQASVSSKQEFMESVKRMPT